MTQTPETPVLIVGGGPAGLALALDLAWRGHRSTIVEQGPEKGEMLFKAGGLNERTLEFCRRWGIRGEVYDWGQPQDYPRDTAFMVKLDGPYIGKDPLPSAKDWPVRDSSPEAWRKCPQYIFDPILAEACRKTGLVEFRYDTELVGFTQDQDGVTVSLRRKGAEDHEQIRAQYVAGCDGATSLVRRLLDIPFEGPTLDYSVSIMLEIDNFEMYHPMGRLERIMFVDTEGTYANITSVDFMKHWRHTLVGSEERLNPETLDVAAHLKRAFGNVDVPYKLLRVVPWRRSQQTASQYGKGRVFLAGDAAHTTSPTGGHGINTGLGDVVGLGWMLDAALSGWAGEWLLDAYTTERRQVAFRNFGSSTQNYKNWVSGTDAFAHVRDEGETGETARADILEHFVNRLRQEWHSYGVAMGYRYEGSPLIVPDSTPEPADDPSVYEQTARPGHRAPHAWIEDGKSTIDLFGRGFILLRFDGTIDVSSLERAATQVGVPLEVFTLERPDIAAIYGRKLCLVRPDGHSAWRGDTLPDDVGLLIDTIRGA